MRNHLHHLYHVAVAALGIGILLSITSPADLLPRLPELTLFLLLSVAVKRAGFHVAPKVTHSRVGVIDLASLVTWGAAGGGWIAGLSGALNGIGIWVRQRDQPFSELAFHAAFSFGLKATMAYVAAQAYLALGGHLWLTTISIRDVMPLALLCILWFALDHLGWGLSEWIEKGRAGLDAFLTTVMVPSLLVELMPLPAGALLAYL